MIGNQPCHGFGCRHGSQAETAALGHCVKAVSDALDLTGLGQTHQGLVDGRTRTQPGEQRGREGFTGRKPGDLLADVLGSTHQYFLVR